MVTTSRRARRVLVAGMVARKLRMNSMALEHASLPFLTVTMTTILVNRVGNLVGKKTKSIKREYRPWSRPRRHRSPPNHFGFSSMMISWSLFIHVMLFPKQPTYYSIDAAGSLPPTLQGTALSSNFLKKIPIFFLYKDLVQLSRHGSSWYSNVDWFSRAREVQARRTGSDFIVGWNDSNSCESNGLLRPS